MIKILYGFYNITHVIYQIENEPAEDKVKTIQEFLLKSKVFVKIVVK